MKFLNGFVMGLGVYGGASYVACCCRRADKRSVISCEDEAGAAVWPPHVRPPVPRGGRPPPDEETPPPPTGSRGEWACYLHGESGSYCEEMAGIPVLRAPPAPAPG